MRVAVPDRKKKRKCLKCGKLFDSPGPGIRRCGTCKSKEGRPSTVPNYGEHRSKTYTKSTGRPKKWR